MIRAARPTPRLERVQFSDVPAESMPLQQTLRSATHIADGEADVGSVGHDHLDHVALHAENRQARGTSSLMHVHKHRERYCSWVRIR